MNIFLVSFSGAFMEYKTQSLGQIPTSYIIFPISNEKKVVCVLLPGAVMEYNTVG